MSQHETELRDGMRIDWNVPVTVDDGATLRADVFRPPEDGRYPVLLSYGPYGKLLHFEDGYQEQWDLLVEKHPEVLSGSSGTYMNWEVVDPERWVPDGYAVVRIDSRGAGRSPGYLDVWSERETDDLVQCIEWAGEQSWSNDKVGLNGISYYAMNQWQVAARDPEHLEAMCAWEGASDFYRDLAYHGGIYCTFAEQWYGNQVETVQYGVGTRGYRSRMTGEWVTGSETLPPEELAANRADLSTDYRENSLASNEYWQSRNPDLYAIDVPLLSAGNWGGHGLHLRGNVEGFTQASSDQKWLEIHGGEHWTHFYSDYGVELQKQFFGHFLKDEDTGWADKPPVQLQVRHPDDGFTERHEDDWPIPRTDWTRYYLDSTDASMTTTEPDAGESVTYAALEDGVTFLTEPLAAETEITGPISANLFVESTTTDADLFLVLRVFRPDMEEVVFQGALDPHSPVAQGWLRASHRALDEERSTRYRPYHSHDDVSPLTPGEVYELDVEIWPTSIVVPSDFRVGLTVSGIDYEYPGEVNAGLETMDGSFTGVGPFIHQDGDDRPADTYGGDVTIHTGPDRPSSILVPLIP